MSSMAYDLSEKMIFHTYKTISEGFIYIGDDHTLEVAGIGTVKIKTSDNAICTIQEI